MSSFITPFDLNTLIGRKSRDGQTLEPFRVLAIASPSADAKRSFVRDVASVLNVECRRIGMHQRGEMEAELEAIKTERGIVVVVEEWVHRSFYTCGHCLELIDKASQRNQTIILLASFSQAVPRTIRRIVQVLFCSTDVGRSDKKSLWEHHFGMVRSFDDFDRMSRMVELPDLLVSVRETQEMSYHRPRPTPSNDEVGHADDGGASSDLDPRVESTPKAQTLRELREKLTAAVELLDILLSEDAA